eukprot:12893411-Prorocentrum_lima.AAC.1
MAVDTAYSWVRHITQASAETLTGHVAEAWSQHGRSCGHFTGNYPLSFCTNSPGATTKLEEQIFARHFVADQPKG